MATDQTSWCNVAKGLHLFCADLIRQVHAFAISRLLLPSYVGWGSDTRVLHATAVVLGIMPSILDLDLVRFYGVWEQGDSRCICTSRQFARHMRSNEHCESLLPELGFPNMSLSTSSTNVVLYILLLVLLKSHSGEYLGI